ncbi:MAG: hypothetical protein KIS92_23555 [Planctomycetota bacterium]|nr:hypothetical protein [Planctomycetota bacterium]
MYDSWNNRRGSVLIMAMIMVTLLAAMTLSFASRIVSNEGRMEVDIASTYAGELAESANDWNMQRIFRNYDYQHDAVKQGNTSLSPIGSTTTDPNAMLGTTIRTTDTGTPGLYDYIGGTSTNFNTRWNDPNTWMEWGPGQVKCSAKVLQSSVASRYTVVELKTWARFRDALTDRYIEREVKRVVRYSVVSDNKIYDFAYFANNYGWMYGSPIYIHGNMGSNGDLGFQGGPTVNGLLYASLNPAIGATGVIKSGGGFTMPNKQSLTAYRAGPAGMSTGDPMVLPANPAYTEDLNNNGALNAGEDTNGNGILDQIDYNLGYKGIQDIQTGQKPLDIPYLGDLNYFKGIANSAPRSPRPDIGDSGGTGGVIKQLKAPGLDPTDPNNYNILVGGSGMINRLKEPGLDPTNPANYVVETVGGSDSVYGNDSTENGRVATWAPSGSTLAVNTQGIGAKIDTSNQERNGNLALIGTPQQPIIVTGPVVVTNDLMIKGVVKGQGTIYVGRNLHVAGDIVYSDAPNFRDASNGNNSTNLNNPNFSSTIENNNAKDLVGFAVKGSVVLGQYNRTDDSWNTCKSTYFKSGFQSASLQSYQVDPTDASIGYVTGYTSGNPYFHGDYTADVTLATGTGNGAGGASNNKLWRYKDLDGWDQPVGVDTDPTAGDDRRILKYMDSVFPYNYMQAMSTAGTTSGTDTTKFIGPGNAANTAVSNAIRRPSQLFGIYYTNHLFGGRVGDSGYSGVKFYGTMVARDEGVVFNTKCQFVYDPRVSEKEPSSHVNIYIPVGTKFRTLNWEELPPGK